eukprot:PITA_26352
MVRKLCLDEDWWSMIDFLLKFTSLVFELLRGADTEKPLSGEVYDVFRHFISGREEHNESSWVVDLSWSKWCTSAKHFHLCSFASGKLFISRRNWSTYDFIHLVKLNRLGSQKFEDLVYVHSNLRLASRRGPKYGIGPSKKWYVELEFPDFDLSLTTLSVDEPRSGIGNTSSNPRSIATHACCYVFQDDEEDEYDD